MRLVGVLVFCIFTASAGANPAFDTWADAFAADWVRLAPETATQSQYFAGAEQDTLDRLLTPRTPARRQWVIALAREGREQLDLWLAGPLDPAQRISAAITPSWTIPWPANAFRIMVLCSINCAVRMFSRSCS
jgi:hypothetical protein